MAATIRDVAKCAGVSVATVSHVLNGTKTTTPETRRRVMEAVRQLGYRPNLIGRSLRTRRTATIGLIIPDITNPFFPAMALGVEEYCYDRGYQVILCNAREDPQVLRQYLDILLLKRVEGLVLVPTSDVTADALDNLAAEVPTVVVDRRVPGVRRAVQVYSDNYRGAYEATAHLLTLGHRRVALLVGAPEVSSYRDRVRGFIQAHTERGLVPDPKLILVGTPGVEAGARLAELAMAQSQPPTAFLTTNSLMTLGVVRFLQNRGLRYPEDVSLVDFDDSPLVQFVTPPVTAVHQDPYRLGQESARALLELLSRPSGKLRNMEVVIPAPLIDKGSTGPPPRQEDNALH